MENFGIKEKEEDKPTSEDIEKKKSLKNREQKMVAFIWADETNIYQNLSVIA